MILKDVKNWFFNNVFWNLFDCSKENKKSFYVNLSEETLKCNYSKELESWNKINLEKSLKVGDEIAGHFVSGHVDGITEVKRKKTIKKIYIIKFCFSKKNSKVYL